MLIEALLSILQDAQLVGVPLQPAKAGTPTGFDRLAIAT